jgi:hypothetical protein
MTPYAVAFQRAVLLGLPTGVLTTLTTYAVAHSWEAAGLAGGVAFCTVILGRGQVEGYLDTRSAGKQSAQ